ncbi:hypothetical protein HJB89_21030 [Rhizobium sp. NZLR8]|uniref:hypothetical protein n=1 Tax=Rhizobium sp. NZLR8 TaxID=2731104 RepID=UPI001C83C6C0|nr:hypothetical protein [Rhizobium sp. NZLR8]MBX5159593.1 hypothetical protein [Rhizobium sp. NZLR8]
MAAQALHAHNCRLSKLAQGRQLWRGPVRRDYVDDYFCGSPKLSFITRLDPADDEDGAKF